MPLWIYALIFWLQSIFDFKNKILRWSMLCILISIQVIRRMELLFHLEESSQSNWKLYHPPTFLLKLDEGFSSPPKKSRLSKIMTLSLSLQSRRWSQRWTNWRRHVSSTTKLEDMTMIRRTPSNSKQHLASSLTMLTGGIRCLHDDVWLYDLVWFVSL